MSENLHIDWILLSKAYTDLDKKVLCLKTLKSNTKVEEKLTLGFKNDMRNFVNFNASSGKSKDLHFDVPLLSIAYNVLAKKNTEELSLITLKKIQTLKKTWFFVWKMAWEVWWTLTWAMENLKICTSMRHFCRKYVMFELKKQRSCVVKNDLYF